MRFAGVLSCALLLSLVGAVASSPADTGVADAQFLTMDPRMYAYARGQPIPEPVEGRTLSAAGKDGDVDADGAVKSRFVAPGGLPATQLLSTGEGEHAEAELGEALSDAGEAELGDADTAEDDFPVHEGDEDADAAEKEDEQEDLEEKKDQQEADKDEKKKADAENDQDQDQDQDQDDDKESMAATAEMLRNDGDPGDAQDTEETLDDNHDREDASVSVSSSSAEAARLRSADLKLMDQLGTADLGKGSVGGELVSRLLGSAVISHSSGHFSTVYSRKRSENWAAKHPVLIGQGSSVEEQKSKKKSSGSNSGAAARAAAKLSASGDVGAAATSGLNLTANGNSTAGNATAPLMPPPLKHLLPLLRFFDHRHKDHICNTDPYEFSNRAGAFQFQGIVAFVYGRRVARESTGKADKELVPFYRYWDQRKMPNSGDHFFSLEPVIKLAGNVTSRNRASKLVPQGVAGYLYTKGYPGLVPLNEYRSNSTGEHLYSVSGTGGMTLNGEGFVFTKTLGYVQPIDAFAKRKAELARKAREAGESEAQKKKDREQRAAKEAAKKKAPKEPESLREVKKRKWHPGQPLFVDNLDWSK